MKTDNKEKVWEFIKQLQEFRQDIYDYDYDDTALWNLTNAITSLHNIVR